MKTLLHTLFFFLLVSQLCFAQWMQVGLNGEVIKDIAVQNQNIFAVTEDNGKLYRSTDSGVNWTMIVDSTRNVALSQTGKVFINKDDSSSYGANIFTSLDNGANWMLVNIVEQIQDSLYLYVGAYGFTKITVSSTGIIFCALRVGMRGIWSSDLIAKSSDDGLTWTTPGVGVIGGKLFDFRNQDWITIGHYSIMYGGTHEHIYLSNNNGNTWNYLGKMPSYFSSWANVLGLFSSGNILVGGTISDSLNVQFSRIFLSTDMCSTWTQISSLNTRVGLSYSSGSTEGMLIGTDSLGLFLFSDEGDSLGSRNEGLTNLNVQALTLDNNGYVYAGTENGVWRRPLSEIVTSVEDEITQPTEFLLSQNWPNPFNPSTKIKYSVPQSSNVVVKVFDILGNEIETLIREEKPIGTYELTWNAENLPSGVYFYQLKAGSFVKTKKMILLK